jgi:hypothetical protein
VAPATPPPPPPGGMPEDEPDYGEMTE